jgi:transposase
MRKAYPDDLTDQEWALIEPVLNENKLKKGRPAKHSPKEILNAIFYVNRTGCQWRHLPHDLPPWSIVYTQLWRWKKKGLFEKIHSYLRKGLRQLLEKDVEPTAAIIDSQTVKTTERGALKALMGARKLKVGKDIYWSIRKGFY